MACCVPVLGYLPRGREGPLKLCIPGSFFHPCSPPLVASRYYLPRIYYSDNEVKSANCEHRDNRICFAFLPHFPALRVQTAN